MQNNKNNLPQIIITINTLKNIDGLLNKLKQSYQLQKSFLNEIDKKLYSFLKNSKKDKNEITFIEELISILPKIITELGIPFVYYLMTQENIMEKFLNLYLDQYAEKVSEIFEISLNIFNFSIFYDYINNLKHYLIEIGIIQNKEQNTNINSSMNPEEILFERISYLLNTLNQLKDIGIDKENLSKLENDYKDILKEIKNLSQEIKITPAKIEFYKELIKPYADYLKTLGTNKDNNNINKENNLNNNEKENINQEMKSIFNTPLDKRTSFFQNEKIKEKPNQLIEFENFNLPLSRENQEEIKRQLCSFLNTEGGRLYLGINEQNIVKGIILNYKKRDTLRNDLVNLTFDFYPKCRLDKIFVFFIPIKDSKTKNFISKKYIIKIRVYQGDQGVLYSMSNKGYRSTIRKEGKCVDLKSTEINDEKINRDAKKNSANQNAIKENELKDPEPEVNQQDLEENEYDNIPAFGNIQNIIKEKNPKNQKKKYGKQKGNYKNYIKEGTIVIKVSNIDENLPSNDVNRFFNGCKCSSQKFFKGYGFLNFSNINDANNCVVNYDGKKLGNKRIKLNITKNEN